MIFMQNIFDCILERRSFSFVKCLRQYIKNYQSFSLYNSATVITDFIISMLLEMVLKKILKCLVCFYCHVEFVSRIFLQRLAFHFVFNKFISSTRKSTF